MAYDTSTDSPTTMQLVGAIHLKQDPDGGALVIDDRTLTSAHVNKAACLIMQALNQPRTREDLVAILAEEANCHTEDAVAHIAQLIKELMALGWIEFRENATGTGL